MNPMTPRNEFNDEQMGELIGQCDRTFAVPSDAFIGRVRGALLDQIQTYPAAIPTHRVRLRLFARYLVAAGIAAAVLFALWLRTPSTWAQMQDALNSRPWIHLRAKLDDGSTHDNWISLTQQKAAFRVGPTARYIDVLRDLQFDYDESRGTVIRAPRRPIQSPDSMFVLFQQLLQGKSPSIDEIQHSKVLATRSRRVIENAKEWLEVELTLQSNLGDPTLKSLSRLEFRVDPESNLPRTMTLTVLDAGLNAPDDVQREFRYEIDYPAEGPADIYALGIPREAKLEDRVPSADTARVLKAIAAGRRDFDSYFAIVFHNAGPEDKPFSATPTSVIWRRGNQLRAEICWPFEPVPPYSERPVNTDNLTWWKQQLKHFRFVPAVVCDGQTGYVADISLPDEKGDQRVNSWKPLATIRKGESLNESHISPVRHLLPEFFAFPQLESSDTTTINIEPAVTAELPRGLLLTFDVTGQYPGAYLRTRYWLDGDRGYATTRMNLDQLDIPRDQALARDLCVEDQYSMRNLQRSPKGFWYPALVLRETAAEPKDPSNRRTFVPESSTAFLLDFASEMPDSLFTTKERKAGF